jgi:hypothetical protein
MAGHHGDEESRLRAYMSAVLLSHLEMYRCHAQYLTSNYIVAMTELVTSH